jgi:hypothetical protein
MDLGSRQSASDQGRHAERALRPRGRPAWCWAALCGCAATVEPPAGTLVDVTEAAGLHEPHWEAPAEYDDLPCGQSERMTGGAAVGDVDQDGDLDLFLPRMDLPGRLLLNDGRGVFTEAALLDEAMAASGAAFADVDGDGDLDLLVTPVREGRPRLYVQAGGVFAEEGDSRGLGVLESSGCSQLFSGAFGDPDRDGDLDLQLTQWEDSPTSQRSVLLDNDGRGQFAVLDSPELSDSAAFSATFVDTDADGADELLIAADWGSSRLLRQTSGSWVDTTVEAGVGTDENGMGTAVGDIDGDGHLDWFVSAIYDERIACTVQSGWDCSGNRLYLGNGAGGFVDGTDDWGVRDGGWGWGAVFADLDADGRLDLAQTGGFSVTPWPDADARFGADLAVFGGQTARLWHNRGRTMVESSRELGWEDEDDGRAILAFDKDGDGDQDLLIIHNLAPPTLLENRLEQGAWLSLAGLPVGSRVRVSRRGGPDLIRAMVGGGSFLGNLSPHLHVGLGDATLRRVTVTWPDGSETTHDDLPTGEISHLYPTSGASL